MTSNRSNNQTKTTSATVTQPTIYDLIHAGDYEKIVTLIKENEKTPDKLKKIIDSRDEKYRRSPIAIACSLGQKNIVELLIKTGADVSSGGLRIRRTTLDYAMSHPEIAHMIADKTKEYLKPYIIQLQSNSLSLDSLSNEDKTKIALLAFSMTDYYKILTNQKNELANEQQNYLTLAEKLAHQVCIQKLDEKAKKDDQSVLATLQAPLNWRLFINALQRNQFEDSKRYLETTKDKFQLIINLFPKDIEKNAIFQYEFYNDLLVILANKDANDWIKQEIILALHQAMDFSLSQSNLETLLKKLFETADQNSKIFSTFYITQLICSAQEFLINHLIKLSLAKDYQNVKEKMGVTVFNYLNQYPQLFDIVNEHMPDHLQTYTQRLDIKVKTPAIFDKEKTKIGLISLCMAQYYHKIENKVPQQIMLQDHYLQIADDLATQVIQSDNSDTTSETYLILTILKAILSRQLYKSKIQTTKYDEAKQYYESAEIYTLMLHKLIDNSETLKSQLMLELYFEFVMCLASTKKENKIMTDEIIRLFGKYITISITIFPLEKTLTKLLNEINYNKTNLSSFYMMQLLSFIQQYLIQNGNINNLCKTNDEYQTNLLLLIDNNSDIGEYILNHGHLEMAKVLIEYSNQANTILKRRKVSETLSKQLTALDVKNQIKLKTIQDMISFRNKLSTFMLSTNLKETQYGYRSFIKFMKENFQPVADLFTQKTINIASIGHTIQSYFPEKSDKMFIEDTQINNRLPQAKLTELMDTANLFMKIVLTTNNKHDLQILYSKLNNVFCGLMVNQSTAISPDILYKKCVELTNIAWQIERAYLKHLSIKERTDHSADSLDVICRYIKDTLKSSNYMQIGYVKPKFQERMFIMKPLFFQCLQELKSQYPEIKIPMTALALQSVYYKIEENYPEMELVTKAIIFSIIEEKELSSEYKHNMITCMDQLACIENAYIFNKFDDESIKKLYAIMKALEESISIMMEYNALQSKRHEATTRICHFWSNQASLLSQNQYYYHAMKVSLFIIDVLTPIFSDKSLQKQHCRFELKKTINLIDSFIKQLATLTNQESVNDYLSTLKKFIDYLAKQGMSQDILQIVNCIDANQLQLSKSNFYSSIQTEIIAYLEAMPDSEYTKGNELTKLKLNLIEHLSAKPLTPESIEFLADTIDSCQALYQPKEQIIERYDEIILTAKYQLAEEYFKYQNKSQAALELYNSIVEMSIATPKFKNQEYFINALNRVITLAKGNIDELIGNANIIEGNLIDAITLYDELINNYQLLPRYVDDVLPAKQKQIELIVTWILQLQEQKQFNKVLQLLDQVERKLQLIINNESIKPFIVENSRLIDLTRKNAIAGVKEKAQTALDKAQDFLNNKSFKNATFVCDQTISKLGKITPDEDTVKLLKTFLDFKNKINKLEQEAQAEVFTTPQNASTSHRKKKKSKANKNNSNTKPDSKPADQEQIEDKNANVKPSKAYDNKPINDNPLQKTIGNRIEAPFIKQGTATLFPVL